MSAGQQEREAVVAAVLPNYRAGREATCIDCGWHHVRKDCHMRRSVLIGLRRDSEVLRQRIANITGEPS